jgi:hypothetical protein
MQRDRVDVGISRLPRIKFGGAVQFGKRIVGSF